MKVALVNTYDSKDIKVWAGIPFYVSHMLEKVFKDNVHYFQLPLKRSFLSYLLGFYFNRIRRKKYLEWTDKYVIRRNTRIFNKMDFGAFDLIITFQFFLVPLLKNKKSKIIWWSDATFNNLLDNYSYVTDVSMFSTYYGNKIQRNALNSSDAIILASDWAIKSAVKDYQADIRKIYKIPFASHLSVFPSKKEVAEIIGSKNGDMVKLLFIGIDWERKGGDDAVAVVENLNRRGKKAIMYVVGSSIPDHYKTNTNLIPCGFIDKSDPLGEKQLIDLIKEASFLILPSRAECFGIVFCEANSYGLPVITTNVGGIPSVVRHGINGGSFSTSEFEDSASKFIMENLPGSVNYTNLSLNSFKFYNNEMSSKQIEDRFLKLINVLFPSLLVL